MFFLLVVRAFYQLARFFLLSRDSLFSPNASCSWLPAARLGAFAAACL